MKFFLLIATFLFPVLAMANESCRPSLGVQTDKGRIGAIVCVDSQGIKLSQTITLDGTPLIRRQSLTFQKHDKRRMVWIYMGPSNSEWGCSDALYLIDLNFEKPKILRFGVKNACNELGEAYWGEKRSTLILKRDVRFFYANGQMTLPEPGLDLVNSIESSAMHSLSVTTSLPFVEDIHLMSEGE